MDKSLEQIAYEAYFDHAIAYEAYFNYAGGRSLATGQTLPEWERLSPQVQAAWRAAAMAAILAAFPDETSELADTEPVSREWLIEKGFRVDRYGMLRYGYLFTDSKPSLIGSFYYGRFDVSFPVGDLSRMRVDSLMAGLIPPPGH